jgi:DNA-directed RNA polymerase subunit RPC12/RpoP
MRYKLEYEIKEKDEIETPSETYLVSKVYPDFIEIIPSKTSKPEQWAFDNFMENFFRLKSKRRRLKNTMKCPSCGSKLVLTEELIACTTCNYWIETELLDRNRIIE